MRQTLPSRGKSASTKRRSPLGLHCPLASSGHPLPQVVHGCPPGFSVVRRGGGVTWDGIPFETPVIPAKAGIQPFDSAFPKVCRVDSRFRGNDCGLQRPCLANDTSTGGGGPVTPALPLGGRPPSVGTGKDVLDVIVDPHNVKFAALLAIMPGQLRIGFPPKPVGRLLLAQEDEVVELGGMVCDLHWAVAR